MKDLPHHMKKLNRRVIRSMHREEMDEEAYEEMPDVPTQEATARQRRKKTKIRMKQETLARTPTKPTSEQRNRKMKKRVPIFDRNNAAPKHARPTKKKSPKTKGRASAKTIARRRGR